MKEIATVPTSLPESNQRKGPYSVKNGKDITRHEKNGVISDFKYDLKHHKSLLAMNIPTIVFFLIFAYLPMFGIIIAFQNFNPVDGIFHSKFVGFDNFKFFLGSTACMRVIFNTLFLNALFILSSMIISILIALMLSEVTNRLFKRVSQSVVILPHFISWTVVALLLEAFLSSKTGFLNKALTSFGLPEISFYSSPTVWPALLTVIKIWQGAGFGSIVYLAAITGIDQEIYEAARIDGASRWQCILRITLPLLKPTAILLLLMDVGKIFNGDFGMIYAIVGNNTLLYPTTDVIDTYIYRQLMELGDMGMSSAVGLLQSVLGFVMVYATNWIARKLEPESAIF